VKEDSSTALRELVYSYYPVGVRVDDAAYPDSEESRRLEAARTRAVQDSAAWQRLLESLRIELPDCRIEDWTHLGTNKDACYRCRVELATPDDSLHAIVACVSIITPFYLTYSSVVRQSGSRFSPSEVRHELSDDEVQYGNVVASDIEKIFGYRPMPPGIGTELVPDVAVGNVVLGKATLYDCLFTDDRW